MTDPSVSISDLNHPQWQRGRITSSAGLERWAYLGMALLWNLFAQPMFWLVALNRPQEGLPALLVAGLFPLPRRLMKELGERLGQSQWHQAQRSAAKRRGAGVSR